MGSIRLATRGSPLARRQTEIVSQLLRRAHPGLEVEPVVVRTRGDQDASSPLDQIGGQGVFVAEVELAVTDGRADAAVHSAKDIPSTMGDHLVLGAVPPRADPRDGLVGCTLADLPAGGLVATGSARRRAQLAYLRPDLVFTQVRGNMARRVAVGEDGSVSAVVVAVAAMERLGWEDRLSDVLDPLDVLPQAIHRRSITLNTGTVGRALRPFDAATDEFYRSPPVPLVDLGRLALHHQEMPRDASRLIRSAGELGGPLEDAGQEIWDAPKLELCALGRAARWGVGKDDDLRGAAAGVLIDALTCAETVSGWVLPDWRDGIAANEGVYRKWLGESRGGSEILARVDRGRRERLGAERSAVVARRQATTTDLDTLRFRAELVESLAQVSRSIERVPERHRVKARGIREVARRLRERAGDVRSMADLVELAELARPTIVEAEELRQRIELEREQEARNAQVKRDRETERRRADAQIKSQAKQAAAEAGRQRKANLSTLRTMRGELVRLKGRRQATSPGEVLNKLIEYRVVAHYFEDRTEELPVNPFDELVAKVRKREIVPVHRAVRYEWIETLDGRRWPVTAFGQWTDSGPQAALAVAIAESDQHIALVRSGASGFAPGALMALSADPR